MKPKPFIKVLIIEHPKCGRVWLRNILRDINPSINLIEAQMNHAYSAAIHRKGQPPMDPAEWYASIHPRIRNTYRRIFLYRDPKDVMISFYYWLKRKKNIGDISQFIKSIYGMEYLLRFYQVWCAYSESDGGKDIIFVSYESMIDDTFSSINNILTSLGLSVDADLVERAIERNVFERMRKREIGRRGNKTEQHLHTRRGKVGDYRNHMSPEDIEYCNTLTDKYPSRIANEYKEGT